MLVIRCFFLAHCAFPHLRGNFSNFLMMTPSSQTRKSPQNRLVHNLSSCLKLIEPHIRFVVVQFQHYVSQIFIILQKLFVSILFKGS